MTTLGVILAAGQSTRFGPENKLMASLGGEPLISYVARSLEGAGCDHLAVVTGSQEVAAHLAHYDHIVPEQENAPQSRSLVEALRFADNIGADRAVVVLGDMPFVSSEHISKLVARCTRELAAASTDGNRVMVPACFPQRWFHRLHAVSGDAGARRFLQPLPKQQHVKIDPGHLWDIDDLADLEKAARWLRSL